MVVNKVDNQVIELDTTITKADPKVKKVEP
jgi:hypothetical protein